MKRCFMIALLAVCLIGILCGCSTGNIDSVEKNIGASDLYSEAEINRAMNIALDHFARNFNGCTMVTMEYDEAYSLQYSEKEAQNHDADEAIILTSTFDVDASGGDGSLEPNSRYNGFQWILTRNGFGGWKLRDWGYA